MRPKSHEQRRRRRTICFVKIVNGAGATSTFFRSAKNRGVAVESPQGSSTLLIKILKPPQTCDTLYAAQPSHRRRATKIKLDFSRWIFTSNKKNKILFVLLMFFIFVSNQVRSEDFRRFSESTKSIWFYRKTENEPRWGWKVKLKNRKKEDAFRHRLSLDSYYI